jgi:DNA-binding SARP family transcriptional activator
MRFGVLGPLAVWTDHDEPVTIPGRKVRALLADLLVHEGRPVSVDRLVEDLWGEAAPADPTAALHVRVSQLRRALAGAEPDGRELVVSQAPGVRAAGRARRGGRGTVRDPGRAGAGGW